ncbi:MAG: 2-hydroxyhepta-2,4-diene-1,7-dioate isomerase [Micrococcales bacterium]|nr:MAG: 2-hydroxyhepta-2,4-diene-1,7-dioate isomerase [Micrococcales bacterium]PIE27997.1 MAG: 2-hydroxyhepta-2,4-diene-1,7-dioate isomerase [Micrococcales bacterium]
MRVARFVVDSDPVFGYVVGEPGNERLEALSGDPLYAQVVRTGKSYALGDVRLVTPVIPRSKVVGIGRNYADHAAEMGSELPAKPLVFFKPNTSVIGADDPILLPGFSNRVEFEGELAVVIGTICKEVPRERVKDVIFGYTCANDVTARDAQASDGQWARAKGFDTACPLGPWIVTGLDPEELSIRTRVDGQLHQDGNTRDLVFGIEDLVEYVSAAFTLLPGDVILTGTPAGVGPIEDGQVVEVEIEGIGALRNRVMRR